MNGLRSTPLSWYCELSDFLRSRNFEASLDPTIFRRLTKKGLTIVLFYVDDLLIFSEDPGEGRRFYEELRQRYKLKLTGELLQDCPARTSSPWPSPNESIHPDPTVPDRTPPHPPHPTPPHPTPSAVLNQMVQEARGSSRPRYGNSNQSTGSFLG